MAVRSSSPFLGRNALLAGALLLLGLAGAHCSSGRANPATGASCLANPGQCPGGQTCWPTSTTTLGCIPSQPSAGFGASCVEQIGQATCADGMLCDATDPDGSGQCTQYCSQSSPCPAGYSCRATQVGTGGPSVDICRATTETTSPGDGGAPVGDAGDVYADALFEVPDVGTGGDASETQR